VAALTVKYNRCYVYCSAILASGLYHGFEGESTSDSLHPALWAAHDTRLLFGESLRFFEIFLRFLEAGL
jgi:hypothetical protein